MDPLLPPKHVTSIFVKLESKLEFVTITGLIIIQPLSTSTALI